MVTFDILSGERTGGISRLTRFDSWAIIPPSSSLGAFMSLRPSPVNVLLLTGDAEIQAQYREVFRDAAVVAAKDIASLPKDTLKRAFHAVIVETGQHTHSGDLSKLLHGIDPTRTLIVAGSRPVLKRASTLLQLSKPKAAAPGNGSDQSLGLETYLEHKVEDFVKGMRNGSGRNLHPMLMSAVERPLIALALQETKGNQIQAAELLGLNRNTLRRKIQDLRIPIKRARTH
jgi:DNA-binding protein Fis